MSGGWAYSYNLSERLLWQTPDLVLEQIGLGPGHIMVDIGCGDGFFAIPAARKVTPQGHIYALDSSTEAIEQLRDNAQKTGITNITAQTGDAAQYIFCNHCADFVFMANVLHDFESPGKVLKCARTMLKPGGRVVDIDWKKEPDQLHGPPFYKRLSQKEAAELLEQAGFRIIVNTLSQPFHYLLMAE